MRLRMQILNRLSPEEQQRVKRGFGPQMRLTSFYESQIQGMITQQNNNAIHIDMGWDVGSGTGVVQLCGVAYIRGTVLCLLLVGCLDLSFMYD
ncbi:MAG: hypothetical protein EZS28_049364 [Streblomastix strix]|uniref:Uncharacterized protein n=1 Tax=Streblomastix strix TaxID=222440 RepID=A0A5J4TA96_9EUKA|nr:MAG: hypothetical protein EZS28_049364 [Streblomastix strix]